MGEEEEGRGGPPLPTLLRAPPPRRSGRRAPRVRPARSRGSLQRRGGLGDKASTADDELRAIDCDAGGAGGAPAALAPNGGDRATKLVGHPDAFVTDEVERATAEATASRKDVRTVQFDTILNEPPVIIIQMGVNTCLPESVPRVIPHLETQITDTSSVQNNIKSGSPGICSNISPGSSICTYRLQSDMSPQNHKEQFYTLNITSSI